jgi:hypothetical protein
MFAAIGTTAAAAATALALGSLAAYELVEIARLAAGGLLLVEKRKALIVKLFEKFIPGDFLERICAAESGEVEPQQSRVALAAGAAHAGGLGAAFLCPSSNFFMISGCPGACGAAPTAAAAAAAATAATSATAAAGRSTG